MINRRTQVYFVTIFIAGLIAWGTLSPPQPSNAPAALNDKVMHAVAFGMLMLPLAWFDFQKALRFAPFGFAYGGLIEVTQPLFGRSAEWADLWADGFGIAAALGLVWLHRFLKAKPKGD